MDFKDCSTTSFGGMCPITCYPDGKTYLDETNTSKFSIESNFVILLGFAVAITLFSFVSMRSAIIKKSQMG